MTKHTAAPTAPSSSTSTTTAAAGIAASAEKSTGDEGTRARRRATVSRSARAGLVFSVSRVEALVRDRCRGLKIGHRPAVAVTALLEYFNGEILSLAAARAKACGSKRIRGIDIARAIEGDDAMHSIFGRSITFLDAPDLSVAPSVQAPAPAPEAKRA